MIRAFCLLGLLAGVTRGDSLTEPLKLAGNNRAEIQAFVDSAGQEYGDFGRRAAEFLVLSMAEEDLKNVNRDLLLDNLTLAIKARNRFPWAKKVPEEIFLNDVLPYASLDETRESWRKSYYPIAAELVKDCFTATEAVQALNKQFFDKVNVHYNTGRKRPNQSPSESQELGMATCTGLSIILVDACRAVGVPARVVGTQLWTNMRGNHTWIEIWDSSVGKTLPYATQPKTGTARSAFDLGQRSRLAATLLARKHSRTATCPRTCPDHIDEIKAPFQP